MKSMSRLDLASKREILRAHRDRRRAAGRILVSTDLPGDLVEIVDQMKEARGLRGRTPIIEEALRFYIEKHERA